MQDTVSWHELFVVHGPEFGALLVVWWLLGAAVVFALLLLNRRRVGLHHGSVLPARIAVCVLSHPSRRGHDGNHPRVPRGAGAASPWRLRGGGGTSVRLHPR